MYCHNSHIKYYISEEDIQLCTTSGSCRLFSLEKLYIMFNPKNAILNDNHELFKGCLHVK